jgi:hypothetical protein
MASQIFGSIVRQRLRAMGIRDKPIAPRSPRQNGFAERLIYDWVHSPRCLDHIIVFGEAHLRASCAPTRLVAAALKFLFFR